MKRFSLFFSILIISLLVCRANTADEVRNLLDSARYDAALKTAAQLVKKSPRDGAANYWYGRAALASANYNEAQKALTTAVDRGYNDAYPFLIDACLLNYDPEKAETYLDKWRAALKKSKKSDNGRIEEFSSRIVLMSNQIDRIEDIPVIARYDVARNDFDRALEKVYATSESGTVFLDETIPFFINNSSREVFWTEPDADGVNRLFTAGILDDGTREEAVELTEYVGDGDIMAPFMFADGETLYFAARDNSGIGGYDLFMTRRDGEGGFYEPSNLGMPYNSAANDILFVIDDINNIGWWVTDRFTSPDSVSVMIFVPNESRVNISSDAENVVSRAKVDDLKSTHPQNFDLAKAKARIPRPEDNDKKDNQSQSFTLSLGDGRILTSTSQFRNREAASAMSEVIRSRRILNDTMERLQLMRQAYADGDKSLKGDIRNLEAEVERQRTELRNLTNRVIRLETAHR